MIKRTLLALGLGVALLGGAATGAHATSHATAHPAATRADLIVGATGPQTADAETGDQSGPDTPDQSGPDTPDQSGTDTSDTPDQSGK